MREYEFRGRVTEDDIHRGTWKFGDLEYNRAKNKARIHEYTDNGEYYRQYTVDPETVGQYTGLKDKNGKMIYEGDIIRITDNFNGDVTCCEVKFSRGVFGVDNWTMSELLTTLSLFMPTKGIDDDEQEYIVEVVGNVYDNPELLKNKCYKGLAF